MDLLFKIPIGLLGLFLVLMVLRSGGKISLTNLPSSEIITRTLSRFLYGIFAFLNRKSIAGNSSKPRLVWFAPAFLFSCIALYFVLTTLGFSLIYWSTNTEPTWFRSFISSGSALSTLGFYTPSSAGGELIAIAEGAIGLGLVVFLITFIPGYQSTIQQREEMSARLYVRTQDEPNGESFYNWVSRAKTEKNLETFWNSWENFLRMIGDTHPASPVLVFTPSSRAGQSWIVSVFAVMDAANLAVTTLKEQGGMSAELCLREGIKSLQRTTESLNMGNEREDTGTARREHYEALCDRLQAAGYTLEEDRDKSWAAFQHNRVKYEQELILLSDLLFVPIEARLLTLEAKPPRRES